MQRRLLIVNGGRQCGRKIGRVRSSVEFSGQTRKSLVCTEILVRSGWPEVKTHDMVKENFQEEFPVSRRNLGPLIFLMVFH